MLTWRWPGLMAVLICFGLASALLGEGGVWWALSWIALAIPLLVILVCLNRGLAR
jgi:hypothetical protein